MLTADVDTTDDAFAVSDARFRQDASLAVKFFNEPRLNKAEPEKQGRPIFTEVQFIRIEVPGNKANVMRRPEIGGRVWV